VVALADRAIVAMRKWLAGQAHRRLLLLCDPAAGDHAAEAIQAAGLTPLALALRHDDLAPGTAPYLVEIDDEERLERFLSATVTLAVSQAMSPACRGQRARSVCAWLHTTRPTGEMARVLGTRSVVTVQGRARLLRFWDPRVLSYRAREDRPDTTPTPVGSSTWFFIDWVGRLRRWVDEDGTPFDPQTVAELAAVGPLNAVLQRVLHQPDAGIRVPWGPAEAALRRALELGIARSDDQIRLAADLVWHGESIVHAAAMQHILSALRAGKGTYAGATGDWDDEDWRRLAAEGARAQQPTAQGQTR
jgi:hypothetical protein